MDDTIVRTGIITEFHGRPEIVVYECDRVEALRLFAIDAPEDVPFIVRVIEHNGVDVDLCVRVADYEIGRERGTVDYDGLRHFERAIAEAMYWEAINDYYENAHQGG